jgi:hypothetical protein
MFNADILTFQDFIMHETLPLSTIQNAVLEFLCNRDDVVIFGAQAVNAYVKEPRMTQDIDILSVRAADLAYEIKDYLSARFHIAVRVRQVSKGRGFRIFQIQKPDNRHLVDLRSVDKLPLAKRISQVLVMAPAELIASKVISYYKRRGKPKSGTDWRDLAMLLLTFPELKQDTGPVVECLKKAGVDSTILKVWKDFVVEDIKPTEEDDDF